ncbi:MAG: phosphopantetheine-binding protein, partial [Vicinamibacteria bacterium]
MVPRTDHEGEPTLVAYVVSPHEGPETAAELRRHLSGRLPAPMVPTAFVFLERLPLTANGKLDRGALLQLAVPKHREPLELPRTPFEKAVAAIWTAILGVEPIGIYEDFFELGGHSLKATQALSRVNQALRLDLPVRVLFENSTIASLSSAIESSLLDGVEASAPGGAPVDTPAASASQEWRRNEASGEHRSGLDAADGAILGKRVRDAGGDSPSLATISLRPDARTPVSLSFAQRRLWVLDRLDPGLSFYNVGRAFWLRGPLDVEALG